MARSKIGLELGLDWINGLTKNTGVINWKCVILSEGERELIIIMWESASGLLWVAYTMGWIIPRILFDCKFVS